MVNKDDYYTADQPLYNVGYDLWVAFLANFCHVQCKCYCYIITQLIVHFSLNVLNIAIIFVFFCVVVFCL